MRDHVPQNGARRLKHFLSVGRAVFQVLPAENAVLPYHEAVRTAFLGNGYGTGIHGNEVVMPAAYGYMSMPVKQNAAPGKRRRRLFIIMMPVRRVDLQIAER